MQRSTVLEATGLRHLDRGGTSVVLDLRQDTPRIVHWGASLGAISAEHLGDLADASLPQRVSGGIDSPALLSLLPLESAGWASVPALEGAFDRAPLFPALRLVGVDETRDGSDGGLTVTLADDDITVTIEIAVTASGLLTQRATVTNRAEQPLRLDRVELSFPLPATAREILDTTGHHLRERHPQRHAFTIGEHVRSSRRGRPGADATLLLLAGTPGFGFERGLVHGVHLAWSGNSTVRAERTPSGVALLGASELLRVGEIELAPGESYATPTAYGSWGDGLTELSSRFHAELRSRPRHPQRSRPVTLNTWEAVYFDHSFDRLAELADRAAAVGVERFVLDDGWFLGRRDDTAGLGDWTVDTAVWPEGLGPLIARVRGLGMEFGLWVEPEMVNPDSDLARDHPDWLLGAGGRLPQPARQQQVLDLSNPHAYAYILEALDALLAEYDIAYLKWDHNRDLLEAVAPHSGRAAVHDNVLALYRLLDELKSRHPGLEIESCASGGSRVDLGILEHTDRIWTSDCIDPLERQTIQPYTGLVVPPELLGAHVEGPRSHSSGRSHSLSFRAGTAMFGHFGIEWDISAIDAATSDQLATWIAFHKRMRPLLHTGRTVRADSPDSANAVYGVVAPDASEALFAFAQLRTGQSYPPGPLTFPGLDSDRNYTVELAPVSSPLDGPGQSPLAWTLRPTVLTGRALATVGVQAPVLFPEQLVLISVTAI
ncbi:alpha-galactosidase [Microbacteriaceae bacterium VKM Ac-2855]|nr:alpha-galactosidase [Microbacteriaceae bacterium VKM Ac-2855]